MLIYDSRDSREIIEKCKKKSPCWKEAGEGKPVERQLGKRFIIPNSLAKQTLNYATVDYINVNLRDSKQKLSYCYRHMANHPDEPFFLFL